MEFLLPEIYKIFFDKCSAEIPNKLVGTDLLNTYPNLKDDAIELLKEENLENLLEENDLVFMMHQGYMFWYFKADGNPDPIVYGYHENEFKKKNFGELSKFLKEYV
jgi:hypothetical protein